MPARAESAMGEEGCIEGQDKEQVVKGMTMDSSLLEWKSWHPQSDMLIVILENGRSSLGVRTLCDLSGIGL